jgi:hypothetical protein
MINLQQNEQAVNITRMEWGPTYAGAEKCSSSVTDKNVTIMEKVQSKEAKAYLDTCITKNPFTILDNFPASHFVNVAQSCGIKLGECGTSGVEIINKMEAQAMLTEARVRKEREMQLEKEKQHQMIVLVGDEVNLDKERDEEGETSPKESLERVPMRKRRQGKGIEK